MYSTLHHCNFPNTNVPLFLPYPHSLPVLGTGILLLSLTIIVMVVVIAVSTLTVLTALSDRSSLGDHHLVFHTNTTLIGAFFNILRSLTMQLAECWC